MWECCWYKNYWYIKNVSVLWCGYVVATWLCRWFLPTCMQLCVALATIDRMILCQLDQNMFSSPDGSSFNSTQYFLSFLQGHVSGVCFCVASNVCCPLFWYLIREYLFSTGSTTLYSNTLDSQNSISSKVFRKSENRNLITYIRIQQINCTVDDIHVCIVGIKESFNTMSNLLIQQNL